MAGQTINLLNQGEVPKDVFPNRLAFNLIPGVGTISGAGEESSCEKVLGNQIRVILDEADMQVQMTGVYVPVFANTGT